MVSMGILQSKVPNLIRYSDDEASDLVSVFETIDLRNHPTWPIGQPRRILPRGVTLAMMPMFSAAERPGAVRQAIGDGRRSMNGSINCSAREFGIGS